MLHYVALYVLFWVYVAVTLAVGGHCLSDMQYANLANWKQRVRFVLLPFLWPIRVFVWITTGNFFPVGFFR